MPHGKTARVHVGASTRAHEKEHERLVLVSGPKQVSEKVVEPSENELELDIAANSTAHYDAAHGTSARLFYSASHAVHCKN